MPKLKARVALTSRFNQNFSEMFHHNKGIGKLLGRVKRD